MKVSVVFYSHSGVTKRVSVAIAEELSALTDWQVETVELKPMKEVAQGFGKYVWGGKQVFMKNKPELKSYHFDDSADIVILGTPVWAFSISPPIRSFLKEHNLEGKQVFSYYTCQGGPGKVAKQLQEGIKGSDSEVDIKGFDQNQLSIEAFESDARQWIQSIVERFEA